MCVCGFWESFTRPTDNCRTHTLAHDTFAFSVHGIYTNKATSNLYDFAAQPHLRLAVYVCCGCDIHCARHVLLRGYFRETETKRARPPSQLHGGEAIHTYIGFVCVGSTRGELLHPAFVGPTPIPTLVRCRAVTPLYHTLYQLHTTHTPHTRTHALHHRLSRSLLCVMPQRGSCGGPTHPLGWFRPRRAVSSRGILRRVLACAHAQCGRAVPASHSPHTSRAASEQRKRRQAVHTPTRVFTV